MARIKGLNDTVTLKNKPIAPSITVWKGEKMIKGKSKKDTRAGTNLNDLFRIEAPPKFRSALKYYLSATERNGSLYVAELNIVPAYQDEMQTFDCKMAAYNASRPILFCDRETINTRFIEEKDPFGGVYFQPVEASEPCPVAGKNFKCQHQCSSTGDFYFYIWELMQAGYAEFARLRVHGIQDIQNIASVLDEVKSRVQSIRDSPFCSEETKSYILYQLSRRQVASKYPVFENGVRTDKRGTKQDWIIHLSLHPLWLNKQQSYLATQQLLAANLQPSLKLIQEVHGSLIVNPQQGQAALPLLGAVAHGTKASAACDPQDRAAPLPKQEDISIIPQAGNQNTATTVPETSIVEAPPWSVGDQELAELKAIWQAHGWNKSALEELLVSYFDVCDRDGIMKLSFAQYQKLKKLSADPTVQKTFVN
jgi:hypothetical protein